jgi:hypothetical protein
LSPMMFDRAMVSRVIIGLLTVAALTYGWMTSYPDNVNLSYGLPLRWGTHQLITIAGPVDTWRVDLQALLVDLLVWVALLIVIPEIVKQKSA